MKRKCGICRAPAKYYSPVAAWCSHEHGAELAKRLRDKALAKKAKAERKRHLEDKRRVEKLSVILERTQKAVNAYVRARDQGKPCISCGEYRDRMEAGHYRPVGSGGGSPVRFDPNNIHSQCSHCNQYKHGGDHPGYRPELVRRIGEAAVVDIELRHKGKAKWDRDELGRMAREFRKMTRELLADERH